MGREWASAVLRAGIAAGMRVLILGGTGFLGSALARALLRSGHEAINLETWSGAVSSVVPDVVVDAVADAGTGSRRTLRAFQGVAKRVVLLGRVEAAGAELERGQIGRAHV